MRKSGKLGKSRRLRRQRRHARIRKKVHGTGDRPRLVVHRSLRNIEGQVVDDDAGRTMVGLSTLSPALREAGVGEEASEAATGEEGSEAGAGKKGGKAAKAATAKKGGKAAKAATAKEGGKAAAARAAGRMLAEQARARGVSRVVFDRGGFRYHGRVKAFAEGAREGGLEF